MRYRILHITDCYLPETMNWLEKTLEECLDVCEHHIYANYYTKPFNSAFQFVPGGIQTNYPVSQLAKIKSWLLHSSQQKALLQYIRNHKIQLVHFHFGQVAIQYKEWIQQTGLPFCISLYGFDYEYLVFKNPEVKKEYQLLSECGGRFIVEGNYSKRIVKSYGIPVEQIFIVHMLFQRSNKKISRNYSEPVRLLQAATFTEKKNQLGLVEALQDRHESRFVLSFYGEVADRSYYSQFKKAVQRKSRHCIQIHGKLDLMKYLELVSNSHFAVNLSKHSWTQDSEGGCPVFLKDSLILGTPVIASNHCDIPELVVDGCNGFLLPEFDSPAVTDVLDRLMRLSQVEYRILCGNAEESVKTNSLQKITRRELLEVYQSML